MKKLVFLLLLFTGITSAQTIIFDAQNKWPLTIGRDSETVITLEYPLHIELKSNELKLYYPETNKYYFDELVTPINKVIKLEEDGRTYFLLEFDHEGLIFYIRITKDDDPNYGIVYGIEIPIIENGQIIAYNTFY
ncbi:MAG: hypothetical protein KAH67_02520 [Flavobacteriaceae bacterium]|nr:hypothetical protein [Flavobacteriaceae bacterium]